MAAVDNTEGNDEIDCNQGKVTVPIHGHLPGEVARSQNLISVISGTFTQWRLHVVL